MIFSVCRVLAVMAFNLGCLLIIQNGGSMQPTKIVDGLTLDSEVCDFGDIPAGRPMVKHTFIFYNQSDKDFEILYVYRSCSCVSHKLSSHKLKHGCSCKMDVSVDLREEERGLFCHKLAVAVKGAVKPLVLTLKGNLQ